MIDQERLINTFCDLVRIDSPSGEEEAVAQELRNRLTTLGFEVKRDAHGNLIAVEEGENPLLLIGAYGHGGAWPWYQAQGGG